MVGLVWRVAAFSPTGLVDGRLVEADGFARIWCFPLCITWHEVRSIESLSSHRLDMYALGRSAITACVGQVYPGLLSLRFHEEV